MLQQYQRDIPIILRCRTPTNSVTRTNMATLAPPVKKKKELLLIQNTSPFWLALILRLILHNQHFPQATIIFKYFEWTIKKITEFLIRLIIQISEPVIHRGRNYNILLHLYSSLHHIQLQAIILKYNMHVNLTATYLSLFACDVIIIISWLLLIPYTSITSISFTGTYEHITD